MYKTGDIQKNIEKLRIELNQIKYPDKLSSEILQSGNPEIYLPIIHYTLFTFSTYVAKYLDENNYDMFAKNDLDFITTAFKALIKLFNYKPILTSNQFFSKGFPEAKVILCSEIIQTIKTKHAELTRKVFSQAPIRQQPKKQANTTEAKQGNQAYNFKQGNSKTAKMNKQAKETYYDRNNNEAYDDNGNEEEEYVPASPKFNCSPVDYEEDIPQSYNDINDDANNQQDQVEIFESSQEFPIQKNIFPQMNMAMGMGMGSGIGVNHSHMQNSKGNNNEDNNPIPMEQSYKSSQQNAIDFSALVQVINTLSGSVTQMANKIEKFKLNIEDRLNKVEAELSLIKNRQNILENKFMHSSNNSNNNSNSNLGHPFHNYNHNNRHDDSSSNSNVNEQIFSFACDDHHSLNLSKRHESASIDKDKEKEKIFSNTTPSTITNTRMPYEESPGYNNPNSNSNKMYYTITPNHNAFTNTNTKTNTIYEDTDRLIENVEKNFKETQRLLNEFN